MKPEVVDGLSAVAFEWTKSRSMLKNTSWTMKAALARMAGGFAAENKRELSVSIPSECPEDVEPRPSSVAYIERSECKPAWHEL